MCGELVQANQKRPMGRITAPMIIEGSRSSGMTRPCFLYFLAKRVLVMIEMQVDPAIIPIKIPMNGRAPTPWSQPRTTWNEIGYASRKP
jgi:hypothetical protein